MWHFNLGLTPPRLILRFVYLFCIDENWKSGGAYLSRWSRGSPCHCRKWLVPCWDASAVSAAKYHATSPSFRPKSVVGQNPMFGFSSLNFNSLRNGLKPNKADNLKQLQHLPVTRGPRPSSDIVAPIPAAITAVPVHSLSTFKSKNSWQYATW